jgi:radical SAM superfamily enzyme YgiQ (UPF0313 family)
VRIAFVLVNFSSGINVGAGYVYASIPAEHEVEFFNTPFQHPLGETLRKLSQAHYDLTLISTNTLYAQTAYALARGSAAPVLLGGPHAVVQGEAIREQCSAVRWVCQGEGEAFIQEFLAAWPDVDPAFHSYAPTDLSELPQFPMHLFPRPMNRRRMYMVSATRGCRSACAYCCNRAYLKHYGRAYLRFRPIDQVLDDIERARKLHDPYMFVFSDEELLTDQEHAFELFEQLGRRGYRWGGMARPESVDPLTAEYMALRGCRYIGMGIECGEETYRRNVLKRRTTDEQIRVAFREFKKWGVETTSYNMIGFPSERDEALCRATVRLNAEVGMPLDSPNTQITWFYPFPGTPLGDWCHEAGLVDLDAVVNSYHNGSILRQHRGKPWSTKEYLRGLGG